jgi:hypothetical protein
VALKRPKTPPAFKTRAEVERYFDGDTIECLMCRRHFKRLHTHLAAKHGVTVEEYKRRFGLPWTRGLTSASSLANSGWTEERKAKAQKVAQKSQFFKLAHLTRGVNSPHFSKPKLSNIWAPTPKHLARNLIYERVP